MHSFAACDLGVNHKDGAVKWDSAAQLMLRFEKHLHSLCRDLIITFLTSLFTSLPPSLCLTLSLPLLSVSNTAKTSALCRWVSLSRLPATGSSMNCHLMRHTVKRKRSSCCRTLFVSCSFSLSHFYPTFPCLAPRMSICCRQQHLCKVCNQESRQFVVMETGFIFCKQVRKSVKSQKITISNVLSIYAGLHSFVRACLISNATQYNSN